MPRYRLFEADGSDVGEGYYATQINVGDTIIVAGTRQARVVDLVPVEEENSPYVGFLKVEPLQRALDG
jgi:hypothetical protein